MAEHPVSYLDRANQKRFLNQMLFLFFFNFVLILSYVQKSDSCLQDKRASGFQRVYHVTDPFIKRLGLEAELQVSDSKCVCVCVGVRVEGKSWGNKSEREIFLCIIIYSYSLYCLS